MTWCVLEPARRRGGWNEEAKEEAARNKAGEEAREGHAEPSRPRAESWTFYPGPKELPKVRSRGRDRTELEFWKLGMENARGKGGSAGRVAREAPLQSRCERKRRWQCG